MDRFDDLCHLADPNCKRCRGKGRWKDDSEDEWGMVMWVKCECTEQPHVPPPTDDEVFEQEWAKRKSPLADENPISNPVKELIRLYWHAALAWERKKR